MLPRPSESRTRSIFVSATFALFFCGYPLVSFLPTYLEMEDRSISVVFRIVCFILAAILCRRYFTLRRLRTEWIWLGVAFAAIYGLRIIYDYEVLGVIARLSVGEYVAYTYGVSFAAMFGMATVSDLADLRYAPVITFGICGVTTILAAVTGASRYSSDMAGRLVVNERLNAILLGHSATTMILTGLVLLLPVSAHSFRRLAVNAQQSRRYLDLPVAIVKTLVIAGSIIVGIYVLGLSASRSPVIALLIGLGLLAAYRRKRILLIGFVSLASLLIFVQVGMLDSLLSVGTDLDRLTVANTNSLATEGRVDLYGTAWDLFVNSPIWGAALLLDDGAGYPHNLVLEALMATGLVGATLLVALLARSFATFLRVARLDETGLWLLMLYVQAFVGTMTSGAIYYDPMIWSTVGLGLGLQITGASHQGLMLHRAPTTAALRPTIS